MAKASYWQRGDAIDFTNGTGSKIDANTIVLLGARIGVAGTDIEAGETGSLIVSGVFELPKATGAITAGAVVYWDATNSNITTTSTNNTAAGFAVAAAASADTAVLVKINA